MPNCQYRLKVRMLYVTDQCAFLTPISVVLKERNTRRLKFKLIACSLHAMEKCHWSRRPRCWIAIGRLVNELDGCVVARMNHKRRLNQGKGTLSC